MGVGPKELFALGIVKLARVPFVVRLGGNRLRDIESRANSASKTGDYKAWIKFKILGYLAVVFLKKTNHAIVVNEELASEVAQQLNSRNAIFVVPQFCEGQPANHNYTLHNPVQLLTVTNLTYSEKAEGIKWLIDQLDCFVRQTGTLVSLSVAGAGVHLAGLKSFVENKEVSAFLKVELLGFVTDLAPYYQGTDVLLYRSFHDATPNVVLESKRYGLPLLINDCREFRKLVVHNVSGFFYCNDSEFFARLELLLSSQKLRIDFGKVAYCEYQENYTPEAIQKKLEAVVLDLVNSRSIW
jgi:glycosyltransferase involved in cell wall biosynthesis